MTKVNITRLDSVTSNDAAATAAINNNFRVIQDAVENTLSRDGTTPNFMDSDLDLNAHRIINVKDPEASTDVITKGWFDRFVDDATSAAEGAVASALAAASSAQASSVSAMEAAARAALAADEAAIAKDWATKMDGPVDGVDYSSKYYASQITPIATDITTVAGISSDVTTVASNATDISTVAGISTDIQNVADAAEQIETIADLAADITAVAAVATDVAAVADDLTNIDNVADNKTNIDTVAGNSSNISTVAGISSDVTTVASNTSNIASVVSNASNINAVAGDITNINAVAADLTNIDNASTYAAEAKQWAVGEPTEPSGGSAKYWAGQAAAGQVQADWTEADNTSKAYIKNKPTIDQSYNASSTNAQSGTAVAEALSAFETLPSQTGHSGEYLTTDGTDASWDNVQGVENAQDENTLGIWQGSQQEWEQAKETAWKFWQTDAQVSTGTFTSGYSDYDSVYLFFDGDNYYSILHDALNGSKTLKKSSNGTTWSNTSKTFSGRQTCFIISDGRYIVARPSDYTGSNNVEMLWANKTDGALESVTLNSAGTITLGFGSADFYSLRLIKAGNKLFVYSTGVDGSSTYYSSSDNGETWTSSTWNAVKPGGDIFYVNGKYVYIGYRETYPASWRLVYSTDGITWAFDDTPLYTRLNTDYFTVNKNSLAVLGNKMVLQWYRGDTYKHLASTSTDGITWNTVEVDIDSTNISGYGLILSNGLLLYSNFNSGSNEKLVFSFDGETWNKASSWISTNGGAAEKGKVVYGNNKLLVTPQRLPACYATFSQSSCYTLDTVPTTSSTVYSAPNTESALTVTTGGSASIVLSDNQTYNRNAAGDTTTYQTAGSLYPNHLAFVDNVGVKIGNTLIADNTDTTEIEQDIENLESGKADKDLVNTGYITNCITQISQDINIELSNGTLTLKKGSKVYVPNGTGVFDKVTVSSDCYTATTVDNTWLVFYKNGTLEIRNVNESTSGTSQPSGNWKAGYNTSTNKVSLTDGSGNLTTDYSLPVAVVTSSDGALTSIDKVFNGFGYIGSTIFSLPGIKALIPMGRNEDGSMINGEITTTSVLTKTETTTGARRIMLDSSRLDNYVNVYYNEDKNILWNSTNSMIQRVDCGSFYRSTNGTITLFASKNPLNILGYSDRAMITGWALPSNTYDDLTLGANNAYYTVPADGYVFISKNAEGIGQYVNVYVVPSDSTERIVGFTRYSHSSGGIVLAGTVPVSKGQRFTVIYNASGATNYFRFVYANGSEWEKA